MTRAEWLEIVKKRARMAFRSSGSEAAWTSFMQDMRTSVGKPSQICEPGSAPYMFCQLMRYSFTEKVIDGFN